jgi:isopropylmalate/homocitrate/citramalate synthase
LGIDLSKLKELSVLTEKISGVSLQPHKAIVGKNSFQHESGMVVAGLLKNNFTAEPYVPELVGQVWNIVIGKKTGTQSLKKKLEELGLNMTSELVESCLNEVKSLSISKKRSLTNEEVRDICQRLLSQV